MDSKKHINTRTLADAFNLAISSAGVGLSTLIIYNNKDLAMDLSGIIHNYRKGKIHYVNLHRFTNADTLRIYLFGNMSERSTILQNAELKTVVFENVDLITKELQQVLRAFYDLNERENLGLKLIFLSRSTLDDERARGEYDAPLYYRISGAVIDCRLVDSELI